MLGAIIGDIVGSIYEFDNIRTKDFPLFSANSTFTDDTVCTIAVAEANLDAFFNDLLAFAQGLNEEEQRASREGLTDEELTLFDLLTQPEPKLSDKEKAEVKRIAKGLLAKLKQKQLMALDWRMKPPIKADVERTIRDAYLQLPQPAYTDELRREKRVLTYAHIYDNYQGAGASSFSAPL